MVRELHSVDAVGRDSSEEVATVDGKDRPTLGLCKYG